MTAPLSLLTTSNLHSVQYFHGKRIEVVSVVCTAGTTMSLIELVTLSTLIDRTNERKAKTITICKLKETKYPSHFSKKDLVRSNR